MMNFPRWCYIFIGICFLIPILLIESVIPWGLFLYFSYKCIKISQNNELNFKIQIIKCSIYSSIAWIIGLFFNFMITKGTSLLLNNIF